MTTIIEKGNRNTLIEEDKVLTNYGYRLKPLWKSFPDLSPSSLDISIVIPCYNAEKSITRLLESALNQQTNYRYEVVAIDDGSSDKTLLILEDFASRYHHFVFFHQDNSGVSIARNKGIEMARGEYIGFADSDDFLSPNYIEILLRKAKQYDADMVQGGYISIHSGKTEEKFVTPEKVMDIDEEEYRWKYISGYIWRSIYRKSCFKTIRFPEKFWHEDMICRLVMMRILKRIVIIQDIIYYKCNRDDSLSVHQLGNMADTQMIDQYWLAKSLIEYTNKHLGYTINDSQYRQLIYEWSCLFWQRTRKLNKKCRKVVFQLASAYIRGLHYKCRALTTSEKIQEQALVSGNFRIWELINISLLTLKRMKWIS